MRKLTSHKVNELNDSIEIEVLDEPGAGNACHVYTVYVPMKNPIEDHVAENCQLSKAHCRINFQKGPITEIGINGISNEALLAVV